MRFLKKPEPKVHVQLQHFSNEHFVKNDRILFE